MQPLLKFGVFRLKSRFELEFQRIFDCSIPIQLLGTNWAPLPELICELCCGIAVAAEDSQPVAKVMQKAKAVNSYDKKHQRHHLLKLLYPLIIITPQLFLDLKTTSLPFLSTFNTSVTRPSLLFEHKIAFKFLNEVVLGRKLLQKVVKQLL